MRVIRGRGDVKKKGGRIMQRPGATIRRNKRCGEMYLTSNRCPLSLGGS